MKKKDENILELLALFPWWVSAGVAVVVYGALRFVIPSIEFENPILKGFAPVSPHLAWVAAFFLIPAVISAFESMRKRKMLDRQSGLDSIRALTWKQFEELLGEAYRRQGYQVKENHCAGPDGGIDLELRKGSARYLVQAKQWKSIKVGVKVVREMFGVMTAEGADGVLIVTSGMFTQEAKNFAANQPIDLVDGRQLLELVRDVQSKSDRSVQDRSETPATPDRCPLCGGELVLRTARKGSHIGNQFRGCSNYPACRYTESAL